MKKKIHVLSIFISGIIIISCVNQKQKEGVTEHNNFTGQKGEIKLVVVDPGHFHANLLQKYSQEQINDTVFVYAPKGPELDQYLASIESYNNRSEDPTSWKEIIYSGDDFLEKVIQEKKGNVVVLAGNNKRKTDYIFQAINAGYNVLADKPMVINSDGFDLLVQTQDSAKKLGVHLYDVMTLRYSIMNIVSRKIINNKALFGELLSGTPDNPSVEIEGVHHFFKEVSGKTLVRPAWFYDVEQQGEGVVDIATHLVDLANWMCFPEQVIDYKKDIEVLSASHWPTKLTLNDFEKSTKLNSFPNFLQKHIKDSKLEVFANGEIKYNVKDKNVTVRVIWNFQAPEGTTDTYNTTLKGTKASVRIVQDKHTNYIEQIFIEKNEDVIAADFKANIEQTVNNLQKEYPYISVKSITDNKFQFIIPVDKRKEHEDHFGMVANKYFGFLVNDEIPDWEISNMLSKYYITTRAYQVIMQEN